MAYFTLSIACPVGILPCATVTVRPALVLPTSSRMDDRLAMGTSYCTMSPEQHWPRCPASSEVPTPSRRGSSWFIPFPATHQHRKHVHLPEPRVLSGTCSHAAPTRRPAEATAGPLTPRHRSTLVALCPHLLHGGPSPRRRTRPSVLRHGDVTRAGSQQARRRWVGVDPARLRPGDTLMTALVSRRRSTNKRLCFAAGREDAGSQRATHGGSSGFTQEAVSSRLLPPGSAAAICPRSSGL